MSHNYYLDSKTNNNNNDNNGSNKRNENSSIGKYKAQLLALAWTVNNVTHKLHSNSFTYIKSQDHKLDFFFIFVFTQEAKFISAPHSLDVKKNSSLQISIILFDLPKY